MFDRPRYRRLPTTRYTIFRRARSSDPEVARRAIAELCEHYRDPIYGHFRDRGEPADRAEDLAQGLFAELIAKDTFAKIDLEAGSVRAYLRKAADRWAKDARKARNRAKRGGGEVEFSLDTTDAESRYDTVDPGLSPEQAWDQRWAHSVLERVFARIYARLVEKEQADRWVWLEPLLRHEAPPGTYAALAKRTGKDARALRRWVSRMRERAEDYIHEELGDQVDGDADAEVQAERDRLRSAGLRLGS